MNGQDFVACLANLLPPPSPRASIAPAPLSLVSLTATSASRPRSTTSTSLLPARLHLPLLPLGHHPGRPPRGRVRGRLALVRPRPHAGVGGRGVGGYPVRTVRRKCTARGRRCMLTSTYVRRPILIWCGGAEYKAADRPAASARLARAVGGRGGRE